MINNTYNNNYTIKNKIVNNNEVIISDPLEQFEIIPLGVICNGFSTFSFNITFFMITFLILIQTETIIKKKNW